MKFKFILSIQNLYESNISIQYSLHKLHRQNGVCENWTDEIDDTRVQFLYELWTRTKIEWYNVKKKKIQCQCIESHVNSLKLLTWSLCVLFSSSLYRTFEQWFMWPVQTESGKRQWPIPKMIILFQYILQRQHHNARKISLHIIAKVFHFCAEATAAASATKPIFDCENAIKCESHTFFYLVYVLSIHNSPTYWFAMVYPTFANSSFVSFHLCMFGFLWLRISTFRYNVYVSPNTLVKKFGNKLNGFNFDENRRSKLIWLTDWLVGWLLCQPDRV